MSEEKDFENMEEALAFLDTRDHKIGEKVLGEVISVREDGLIVDFGGKSEGWVPESELIKSLKSYRTGLKLELQIIKINDEEGTIVLSERRPKYSEIVREIEEKFEKNEAIFTGRITEQIKGGYRVLVGGVVEAFLPGSHSLIKSGESYPRGEIEFMVINFERRGRRTNIVVSRRAILDKKIEEFFKEKKVGDIIEGTVERIMQNGIVVRINDVITGFIPRSEISYDPSITPKEVVESRQNIAAKIMEIDPESRRVILSLKALMPDPWESVERKYPVGSTVTGVVKSIHPFGFFVNLEPGVDGLVPYSEVFWGRGRKNLRDVVKVGDIVKVEVINLDKENRKITLSYKKAKGDPWETVPEKYPVGNVVVGKVAKILPTGAIVEIEDGVSGFVPISEISWNYIEKPEEVLREGRKIKVKILGIDTENRRMRLSVRETTENPWKRVMEELDKGSVIKGKVKKVMKSGVLLEVRDYNVDAFLPSSHYEEEPKVGEEIEAMVLRVLEDRRGNRMIVSVKELIERRNYEDYKRQVEAEKVERTLGEVIKGR